MDHNIYLLKWVNCLSKEEVTGIQQLSSGVTFFEFCEIINTTKPDPVDDSETDQVKLESRYKFIKDTIDGHFELDSSKLVHYDLCKDIGNQQDCELKKVSLLLLAALVHHSVFHGQGFLNPLHELEANVQEYIRSCLEKLLTFQSEVDLKNTLSSIASLADNMSDTPRTRSKQSPAVTPVLKKKVTRKKIPISDSPLKLFMESPGLKQQVEIKECKREATDLRQRLNEEANKTMELEYEVQQLRQEIQGKDKNIQQLQINVNILRPYRELAEENNCDKLELEEKVAVLEKAECSTCKAHESVIRYLESENKQLIDRNDHLDNENNEIQAALKELNQAIIKLEQSIVKLKAIKAEDNLRIQELTTQNQHMAFSSELYKRRYCDDFAERNQKRGEHSKHSRRSFEGETLKGVQDMRVQELEAQVAKLDHQIQELKAQKNKELPANKVIAELRKKLRKAQETEAKYLQDLDHITMQYGSCVTQAQTLEIANNELKADLLVKEEELKKLKSEHDDWITDHIKHKCELQQLSTLNDKDLEKRENMNNKLVQLEKEKCTLEAAIERLNEDLQQLVTDKETAEKLLNEKLCTQDQILEEHMVKISGYQDQILILQQEKEQSSTNVEHINSEYNSQLVTLENDKMQLSTEFQALQGHIQELSTEKDTLEEQRNNEICALNKDIADYMLKMSKLDEKVMKLQNANEQASTNLQRMKEDYESKLVLLENDKTQLANDLVIVQNDYEMLSAEKGALDLQKNEDLAVLTKSIEEWELKSNDLEEKLTALNESNQQSSNEILELRENLSYKDAELDTLKMKVFELSNKFITTSKALKDAEAKYQENCSEVEYTGNKLQDEIEKKHEIESKHAVEITNKNNMYTKVISANIELRKEKDSLRQELEISEAENRDLQQKIQEAVLENNSIMTKCQTIVMNKEKTSEEKLTKLEAQKNCVIDLLQKEKESLQQNLDESNDIVQQKNEQISTFQAQIESSSVQLSEKIMEIKELQNHLKENEQFLEEIKKVKSVKDEKICTLEKEKCQLVKVIQQLQEKVEFCKNQQSALQEEAGILSAELLEKSNEVNELQNQIHATEKKIDEEIAKVKILQDHELSKVRAAMDEQQALFEAKENEFNKEVAKLKVLKDDEIAKVQAEWGDLIASLQTKIQEINGEITELRNSKEVELSNVHAQMEALRATLEAKEKEFSERASEWKILKDNEIFEMKVERENLQSSLEDGAADTCKSTYQAMDTQENRDNQKGKQGKEFTEEMEKLMMLKDKEILTLETERKNLLASFEKQGKELTEEMEKLKMLKNKEILKLETEKKNMLASFEDKLKLFKEKETTIEALENEINELKKLKTKLATENESLSTNIGQKGEEIKKLQDEAEAYKNIVEKSTSEVKKMGEKLEINNQKVISYMEQVTYISTKYNKAKELIEKAKKDKKSFEKQLEVAAKKIDGYQKTCDKKTKGDNLADELQLANENLQNLKKELEDTKESVFPMKQRISALEKGREEQEHKNDNLELQLQLAEAQLKRLEESKEMEMSKKPAPKSPFLLSFRHAQPSFLRSPLIKKTWKGGDGPKKKKLKPNQEETSSITSVKVKKEIDDQTPDRRSSRSSRMFMDVSSEGGSICGGPGIQFRCEDEEDFLNHSSLRPPPDKTGLSKKRIEELKRRNTLCLPHMKSSYAVEIHSQTPSNGKSSTLGETPIKDKASDISPKRKLSTSSSLESEEPERKWINGVLHKNGRPIINPFPPVAPVQQPWSFKDRTPISYRKMLQRIKKFNKTPRKKIDPYYQFRNETLSAEKK